MTPLAPGTPLVAMLTRKGQDLLALGALMGILALGAVGAVAPIRVSQRPVDFALDPSPRGYTWSLLLFALPCVVFGVWISRQRKTPEQRRACALTLAMLIPIGFLMDLLLGRTFLTFPNPKATLGILVPAYDRGSGCFGP